MPEGVPDPPERNAEGSCRQIAAHGTAERERARQEGVRPSRTRCQSLQAHRLSPRNAPIHPHSQVPQSLKESKENVDKRIDFIIKELKKVEDIIRDNQNKQAQKRQLSQKLQEQLVKII